MQRDENPHQELLVFSFQRQRKAINDAKTHKKQELLFLLCALHFFLTLFSVHMEGNKI